MQNTTFRYYVIQFGKKRTSYIDDEIIFNNESVNNLFAVVVVVVTKSTHIQN